MSDARFDEVIHAPLRLRLCASLVKVDEASFALLRELLDVSDSVLSKHLSTLADAGYVRLTKASWAGRLRTAVALTPAGRRAYAGHLAALREILDDPT